MAKLSSSICVAAMLAVAGGSSAPHEVSRYLRPTAEEIAAAPCTIQPLHSSPSSSHITDNGSLQESGTISIGNKVFNIVDPDEGNTMSIGNKVFPLVDKDEDTISIGDTKLTISS